MTFNYILTWSVLSLRVSNQEDRIQFIHSISREVSGFFTRKILEEVVNNKN